VLGTNHAWRAERLWCRSSASQSQLAVKTERGEVHRLVISISTVKGDKTENGSLAWADGPRVLLHSDRSLSKTRNRGTRRVMKRRQYGEQTDIKRRDSAIGGHQRKGLVALASSLRRPRSDDRPMSPTNSPIYT
jgi:hypothetical protein